MLRRRAANIFLTVKILNKWSSLHLNNLFRGGGFVFPLRGHVLVDGQLDFLSCV